MMTKVSVPTSRLRDMSDKSTQRDSHPGGSGQEAITGSGEYRGGAHITQTPKLSPNFDPPVSSLNPKPTSSQPTQLPTTPSANNSTE